ncbi:hypothetical protein GLS40_06960 [Pseudooceanicola sp. 216_PA32_1]|uniref:Uncharacterized protein n=1 Tax=Pseudooceanicola pacificus TaxID=2676438 RepID=A0A844WAQ0_9RHOB|nr:DUF6476 family protein [Pseudooceanicola pacificus]MWB77758.1 hypothetical protein [Pseudooceanicola pacificus]
MTDSEDGPEEPANLRFLRRLVTGLTAVMMAGVLLIIVLIVIRFRDAGPVLPDSIDLPDGAQAVAVTAAEGWYAVVTDDNRILIFDRVTGQLRQTVVVD